MKVKEMIQKLSIMPEDADVMIVCKNDACDLCSHAKREQCSLEGTWNLFAEEPFLHEASDEVRIGGH